MRKRSGHIPRGVLSSLLVAATCLFGGSDTTYAQDDPDNFTITEMGAERLTQAQILPVISGRSEQAQTAVQQALAICQNHDSSTLFSILHDCQCIAEKVGQAYARGQIKEVDAQAINRYSKNCPSGRDQLRRYFEQRCYEVFGNLYSDWASNGGCECAGNKSADKYLRDPRAFIPNLTGIIAQSSLDCGHNPANSLGSGTSSSRSPANPRVGSGNSSALPGGSARAGYTELGNTPAGLRPLKIWLLEGRPVVQEPYNAWTGPDLAFSYGPQERAVPRFYNLLLLAGEPDLLKEATAAAIVAGENLGDAERNKLMEECSVNSSPTFCQWAGTNEFERRAARQQFLDRYAASLQRLGQSLPKQFVYVKAARIEDFDAGRGGFPIVVVGSESSGNRLVQLFLAPESLFGFGGPIAAVPEHRVDYPSFWPISEANAERLLDRLSTRRGGRSNRFVNVAWTFEILRIEAPGDSQGAAKRVAYVKPIAIRLYADGRLTDQIGELAVGSHSAAVAGSDPAQGGVPLGETSGNLGVPTAVPMKPLSLEKAGGRVLIDPTKNTGSLSDANARYFNLLFLNTNPGLRNVKDAALKLSHQNLIGLTKSSGAWAGETEFARGRAEAQFVNGGVQQVVELANGLRFPQEIVIRRPAHLGAYDFQRQGFPILLANDGLDRVSGFSALDQFRRDTGEGALRRAHHEAIGMSAVVVRWRNSAGPLFWKVPPAQAQAIVSGQPARSNGWRPIYIGSAARLHGLREIGNGRIVFDGELVKVGLYWDAALTEEAVSLPLGPRVAAR